MQTKLVNNHDSMRLDIMADNDKKTFISFGFGRYRTKLTLQGKHVAPFLILPSVDHLVPSSKGGANYGERLAAVEAKAKAAKTFADVCNMFDK